MREHLAANSNDLLNDSVSLKRGVGQDLADDEQHESGQCGGFHEKRGGVPQCSDYLMSLRS